MSEPIVDSQSESEVLRASVIMLIRLADVAFGPWAKEPEGSLLVRNVTMQVTIEEKLKGEVRQRAGEPFAFMVRQRGTGDVLVTDYYGLWSHVPLADDVRLVAFCHGNSDDSTILLTEEYCEQLVDPNRALGDTKAALSLETEEKSPEELLAEAAKQASQRGEIFARYVAAKAKKQALPLGGSANAPGVSALGSMSREELKFDSSNEAFEALMALLEDPKTTIQARAAYLTSIYEDLSMMAAPPREMVFRLVRGLFKLLSMPEAQALHDNIKDVYLSNLLGLKNNVYRYSAVDVFEAQDEQRLGVLASLRRAPQSESGSRLIHWLEAAD